MADDKRLLGAIDSLRTENANSSVQQEKRDNQQTDKLGDIASLLKEQLRMTQQGLLDSEEARREKSKPEPASAPGGSSAGDVDEPEFDLKGVLGILAGIGASVAGFATGLVAGLTTIFTGIIKRIGKFFKIDKLLKGIKFLGKSLDMITGNVFTLGVEKLRGVGDGFKNNFGKVTKQFTRTIDNLTSAFKAGTNGVKGLSVSANGAFRQLNIVEKIFRTWGKTVGNISKAGKDAGILIDKISKPFKSVIASLKGVKDGSSVLGKSLKTLFNGFKTFGKFIAFPLTIVMGIIDAFKGFQAGQKRQVGFFGKLIGGLGGAITGVLKGLVAMPLDLIKDLISWIAGKLGFENFSKLLDSFSFGELFQKIGDSITDGFVKFFDGIVYVLKNAWSGLMKPFQDGFSFGAVAEFIITLPYKFVTAILDLVKNGVSALLSIFGQEDAAASLDEFSFIDTFEGIINFVKTLPGKLVDKLVGMFEGFDIGASLEGIGDFATAAMNQLKALIRNILPDPDSILAKVIPDALYEWTDTPAPPPPKKPAEPPVAEDDDKVKEAEEKLKARERELGELNLAIEEGEDVSEADLKRAEQRVKLSEANLKNKKKAALDPNKMTDEKGDVWGDEFIDPVTGEIRRQRIFKADPQIQAKIDKDTADFLAEMDALEGKPQRPDITPQTARGNDIAKMSKENAQSAGATNVVVAAPQQQTVNNNNTQSTTAVMDQNLPTVDQNDRTWAYGT